MNPKVKHYLLDTASFASGAAAIIASNPTYHNATWVPVALLVLALVGMGAKTFAIGDIPPNP